MKDTKNTEPRLPITHELKCWPEPFAAVVNGTKTFEWRKDDRPPPDDFRVGDTLWLREWIPDGTVMLGYPVVGHHTGQHVYRRVTYIIREGFGIPEGYCIMGLAAARSKDKEGIEALQASLLDLAKKSTARIAALEAAAQAVINRWDSPRWEWDKHGHTASLIADLRALSTQQPTPER